MTYIPRTVPTDSQILFGLVGIAVLFLVAWFIFDWMTKYAERKKRELEEELEELEKTGELY